MDWNNLAVIGVTGLVTIVAGLIPAVLLFLQERRKETRARRAELADLAGEFMVKCEHYRDNVHDREAVAQLPGHPQADVHRAELVALATRLTARDAIVGDAAWTMNELTTYNDGIAWNDAVDAMSEALAGKAPWWRRLWWRVKTRRQERAERATSVA
ncbi:hypothetical protein FM103_02385 [Corynebacterium xerosis]|nr:hypothetical protein FM103_02385 [Corynebacterium xerosis]